MDLKFGHGGLVFLVFGAVRRCLLHIFIDEGVTCFSGEGPVSFMSSEEVGLLNSICCWGPFILDIFTVKDRLAISIMGLTVTEDR